MSLALKIIFYIFRKKYCFFPDYISIPPMPSPTWEPISCSPKMTIVHFLVVSALVLSCQAACLLPSTNEVSWLPANAAPCVHPGQPLLQLGGNDTAESGRTTSEALRIRSPFVSYDPPYFFASQRLCFYDAPVQVNNHCFSCNFAVKNLFNAENLTFLGGILSIVKDFELFVKKTMS